jgi:hypothetical protein
MAYDSREGGTLKTTVGVGVCCIFCGKREGTDYRAKLQVWTRDCIEHVPTYLGRFCVCVGGDDSRWRCSLRRE